jgi:asparagine synthase (glutamine-hydrolysing)
MRFDRAPVEPAVVRALARPAPGNVVDALEIWHEGPVGLGQALAAVTPESAAERAPLVDATSGSVLVFDGRLDNRGELRRALGAHKRLLDLATDAAYTMAAFLEWGEGAPARLLGDFAFAVWDPRSRRLVLARDPLGVRVLYSYASSERFVFASTLEQLLSDPSIPREIDRDTVEAFLYAVPLGTRSFLTAIRPVQAGHVVTVGDAPRSSRYWHPPEHPPERLVATGDEPEEFRELFLDAVRCRLRSTEPVGLLLSGGLDSGSVGCVAGALGLADRLRTYSFVFEEFPECDERPYIDAITERYPLPNTEILCDDRWTLTGLEHGLPTLAEPLMQPYEGFSHRALALARDDGVRTMLMGHGGDNLLTGEPRYLCHWFFRGCWGPLRRELRARQRGSGRHYAELAARELGGPLLPGPISRRRRAEHVGAGPRAWVPPRLNERFAGQFAPVIHPGPRGWWYEFRDDVVAIANSVNGSHIDRMMRLFGLEARQPFMDPRLVEFVLRSPPDALNRGGVIKVLLRDALHDVLPPKLRERPGKTSYRPLMAKGLREKHPAFVRALVEDNELERHELVVPEAWRAGVEEYLAGDDEVPIWRGLTIEMWLRLREGRLPPVPAFE